MAVVIRRYHTKNGYATAKMVMMIAETELIDLTELLKLRALSLSIKASRISMYASRLDLRNEFQKIFFLNWVY